MKILISGAGVAGLTLAFWLRRYGFQPTLVERSRSLRTGGYKVDIRGVALDVIKRMGLYTKVSASHTDIRGATVVDASGTVLTEMSGDTFNLRTSEDLEIFRGDLCQILMEELKGVECIFGDSIQAITQLQDGVKVDFEKNRSRTFDLVVGADGLHSNVRQLVFGPENQFLHDLGLYISIFTIPNYLKLDRWEMECSEAGRLVNVYSAGNQQAKAAFLFTSKEKDLKPQQLLCNAYADMGWEVPKLLEEMKNAPDFYFDTVAQIEMNTWSKNRVVLLGDAGYCASPVSGQGTSLALVGAYVLAGELAQSNYTNAFQHYEKILRHFVKQNQKLGRTFAKNMTGENRFKITVWLHEQLMRILPHQFVNFITERSANRVADAANSLALKNYPKI